MATAGIFRILGYQLSSQDASRQHGNRHTLGHPVYLPYLIHQIYLQAVLKQTLGIIQSETLSLLLEQVVAKLPELVAARHDLPGVGRNLQDHINLCTIWECTGPHSYDGWDRPDRTLRAGLQYLLTKRGPAASSLFETGGFWYTGTPDGWPDIQFHLGHKMIIKLSFVAKIRPFHFKGGGAVIRVQAVVKMGVDLCGNRSGGRFRNSILGLGDPNGYQANRNRVSKSDLWYFSRWETIPPENRIDLAIHIDTAMPWTINASLDNESLSLTSLVAAMAEMTNPATAASGINHRRFLRRICRAASGHSKWIWPKP